MTQTTLQSKPVQTDAPSLEGKRWLGAPHGILGIWSSVIGKKIVMAVTGAILILFLIGHVLGNLKIFSGPYEINEYSHFLREVGMPELAYGQGLWIVRIILLTCVILHIIAATQLTAISWRARPIGYKEKKDVEATWSSRTMRWGGLLIAIFIVFHLLHFTAGVVGFQPGQFENMAVYRNVVTGFQVWPVSLFYIVAMFALCLHLDHGIWSGLQTLGCVTVENTRSLRIFSRIMAILIFAGFVSVPIAVLAGWVR